MGFGSTEWVVMTGAGYRGHLRAVVATSAAPYGYTLTLRTQGAVTSHAAHGLRPRWTLCSCWPAPWSVRCCRRPCVRGHQPGSGAGRPCRSAGLGRHAPAVGRIEHCTRHDHYEQRAWSLRVPVVGFTATTTYLLVIGVQFWFATRRGHVAGSIDPDGDAPPLRASPTSLDTTTVSPVS